MNKKIANKSVEMQKAYLEGVKLAGGILAGAVFVSFTVATILHFLVL
jgi:hypothetical protein